MNFRLLSKLLGLLLLLLSLTMSLCLAFAWWDTEHAGGREDVRGLALSAGVTAVAGLVMMILGRGSGRDILRKEAVAIVGLGWLFCAAFGALPFMLAQPALGPVPAFFEAMSGFTTTGSTVIQDLTRYPAGILMWRAFTQWLGGLGILVLFVALLSSLGVGSKALFQHESSAKHGGGVKARIQDVAARLWQIYLGLSILCWAGLMLLGMNAYEAATHTMTTLSTGGFSTRNESVGAFQSVGIELWLTLFMLLGGISFMLYAWLLRGRWDRWRSEEEAKVFLGILLVATVVIAGDLVWVGRKHAFLPALRESLFQVVSITTTTGFGSADFDQWPPLSRVLLLVLMAVGGCAGSTAGGVKVSRWVLFFKSVRQEVVRAFRPNQVFSLRLNGQLADETVKLQTVFFIALSGVTVGLGTLIVSTLEPRLGLVDCLSAVMATLFNIGPGLASVGPTQNFAHLGPGTLGFLSLLMLLGRLEFFAVLVLFMPSLWRRY
ncbi:MAG: TrkH family potassium uptake protein [Verrucomicrobiales bacterium]|nr:TrkH family potassium uptake protein [Verrucomicrobiales bacterium]